MRFSPTRLAAVLTAVLLGLGLAQLASAQDSNNRLVVIKPVNDRSERCLARVTGGFSLATCDGSLRTVPELQQSSLGFRIAFGKECVSVQRPVGAADPWLCGTRLQAVPCSEISTTDSLKRGMWTPSDSGDKVTVNRISLQPVTINASLRPEKCLSLMEDPGSLRAVILDCGDPGVTRFFVTPSSRTPEGR